MVCPLLFALGILHFSEEKAGRTDFLWAVMTGLAWSGGSAARRRMPWETSQYTFLGALLEEDLLQS